MRILLSVFTLFLLFSPHFAISQTPASAQEQLKVEKEKFLLELKTLSMDTAIVNSLTRHFRSEVNSINASINANGNLPLLEKEKAVRSLVYFLKELNKNMSEQKSELYDIPEALQSYKNILQALINHKPFSQIMVAVGPRRSQLLATAFSQYKESAILDEIAVHKRVAASPEFILQFLENKPGFRFADSLLLNAAAHDPLKIVSYLNNVRPGIQENIRNSKNIYLQQIVAISNDKQASELLPFINQLAENRLTTAEILEKRTDVAKYFQLLVNTMIESRTSPDSSSIFLKTLRSGLRQKSIDFYVNQINDLHNAADPVRFASVKDLRPEDIYYIMTSAGEELYTSSYLGLYKRLMLHFKEQSADSLFDIVHYDNFLPFMRLAANYNVLADFLGKMPQESMISLVNRFIAGIDKDPNSGLERAMDIADAFTAVRSSPDINMAIENELQSNLKRTTAGRQYFGMRLYGILLRVFGLVKQEDGIQKLWSTLGNYEILKNNALQNPKGEIIELVLFYGDEDGVASFSNFQKLYTDSSKWRITKNENWISIRSNSDSSLHIYANRPLDIQLEMDLRAQDSLVDFLGQQSLQPTVLIHRGHSYHLEKTLRRLTPSVQLAILGSCGSYNKAISIATINPDVQVIGSKKTGSKSINDPIIDVINQDLVSGKDLSWPDIWKKLAARFSKDEFTLSLFNEYFPPSNNVSLFVLKLFNQYKRFA